jgi:ABC-type glycerol-3-phosphate transport system permease component
LENFRQAVSYEAFRTYFKNSLIVAVITTFMTIIISLMGAYGFTRTHFPGRKVFLMMVLFSQMICLAAISVPVAIWLLKGFIQEIPVELEESARVDGASKFQAFYRIVLPLLRPGIGAAGAYVFFLSWQEFLFSLIIMTDKSKRTLPTGIMDYVEQYETSWGSMMASSILLVLPVFVIFAAVQKQLVAGLTDGAVKG